jgi:hypothetical protein
VTPLPQQLIAQAETISLLNQQRDLLALRSMQEHERWDAEKDQWMRMIAALAERALRDDTARADVRVSDCSTGYPPS